jgi:hypothetical protein
MYIRSLLSPFQVWPAKVLALLLFVLIIWVSCVLLAILIDPNFPDDVPVTFPQLSRYRLWNWRRLSRRPS